MDFIGIGILIRILCDILCHFDYLLNHPLSDNDWIVPGAGILIYLILAGIQKYGFLDIGAFCNRLLLCKYTDSGILILPHIISVVHLDAIYHDSLFRRLRPVCNGKRTSLGLPVHI